MSSRDLECVGRTDYEIWTTRTNICLRFIILLISLVNISRFKYGHDKIREVYTLE